eukprot:CAMPEP_0175062378 /NCGR_PEP_ID=MMETSP0052_2-20121109/14136_1 /TAXON_ID=51329 ORGANISM="Polytomella parva, Strain SAG 63-3" /NCGR_SAMPLE_ID=MMETSP0052_2 /ASSEMBLY_ACC=CAM_ASM_000194 /LENGTH=87 /DNA_ID=CAMNT_0016328395 /DNA_START=46 /DNA_END=309 /DNA_ORIENTATION=+
MPKAVTKKEKKEKDPNAPKKPCGAYMWFCKEKREGVKSENPEMSVTDIGKRLGQLWKESSEEEKQRFHALAKKDKERYDKELAEYKS